MNEEEIGKYEFKEVVSGDSWKPEEEGDRIAGILLHKESATNDVSARYTLEVDAGKQLVVWGSANLDPKMLSVGIGDVVIIEYKGKKDLDKGKTLKLFKVLVGERKSK